MLKTIKNILCTVILVVLVITVICTFYQRITGGTPQIFGYSVYRISSGSMVPDLQIGDIIVSGPVSADQVQKGDVITYNGVSGDMAGKIITHKVVETPYEENGIYHFQTCGIAPAATNDPPITSQQLMGKYLFTVPFAAAVYNVFITPWGLLIFIGILCLMFGNEVINLVRIIKDKPTESQEDTDSKEDTDSQEDTASAHSTESTHKRSKRVKGSHLKKK